MNFSFMLAGTASTNPVLLALALLLVLAWKIAGYWGARPPVAAHGANPWEWRRPPGSLASSQNA